MTTSMLDRVPVERISQRAASARPGRTLLALLGGLLLGLGWLAAKVFVVTWRGLIWSWSALAEGWEMANGPTRGQQIASLQAQVKALREANARLGG